MKNLSFLMCVLVLAACGKSNKADLGNSDKNRDLPTGSLYKIASELLASKWAESCDRASESMIKELTQVLDSKMDEINAFASTGSSSKIYRSVPFGKSQLQEYIQKPKVENQWLTDQESWITEYAFYQRIKNTPISGAWVQLNSGVRSMLTNDRKRIYFGQNLDLHHDSEPKVLALKEKVDLCVADPACIVPSYAPEDLDFMNKVGFYSYFKNELAEKKDRKLLEGFQKRLKNDYDYIGFEKNSTVQVKKDGTVSHLVVPFDGSEFSDDQKKKFEEYTTSVWKSADLDLQIEWKDSLAGIYKVFFDLQNPGKRSSVNQFLKEMHLFPLTLTHALAHEMGHVLGFSDHYFPTWNENTCIYTTESNPSDLMAGGSTGEVTTEEWATLKKSYLTSP